MRDWSELCLVVVVLVDLDLEEGGGIFLHAPDVLHTHIQPRVHGAEHHSG